MRIAQIAPLAEAVPPKLYGGTERVVWWLTEALVDLGHDVTLFASGDSITSAKLIPCAVSALRLSGIKDHLASTLAMVNLVEQMADDFDVLHFHIDMLHYPAFRDRAEKCLTTLHGRQDLPDFWPLHRAFPQMKLVSISDAQRIPIRHANFSATVHHGLPRDLIRMGSGDEGYLAFLGRISPEKRPDRAIEIARRTGMKLKIAAKVDHVDKGYFAEQIEPLLKNADVDFIGEISDNQKSDFLGNAAALLFPIDWPEPFGLVMIEAMAAGTPVIAWRNGSTPEVVEHRRSGFLVDNLEQAVEAVHGLPRLPREGVRAAFEERFTSETMARSYLSIYESLVRTGTGPGLMAPKPKMML
jgi:glycosyltransferase involved in cell wall biosynthesis